MCPPVSPHKGASIVQPPRTMHVFFAMETPLRSVWVDCAWTVDFVWVNCAWAVGFIWVDCVRTVDVVWVDCA